MRSRNARASWLTDAIFENRTRAADPRPSHPPTSHPIAAKEADRNTEYLERLGRAPLSSASPHHHVVLDHSDVPGLAGARSPSARDDRRAYPSWDEHGDTLGGAPNAVDDEIDAAYVAALPTASPGARAAAARAAAPYGVGAFPGHLEPAPQPSSATRHPGPPGSRRGRRSSFAVRGEDPLEFDLDPRAVAEAEAAEAKRVELRRQLDEQVAQKNQRRAAMRGRGDGSSYDDAPGPENSYSATVSPGIGSPGRQYAGPAHGFVPQRDVIPGVPRRGVNPGNGEYSSPMRRAGGGPSAWYDGALVDDGADGAAVPLSMGGDGVAPGRLPLGAPGMFPARAPSGPSQAELARLQLVADLDEQVRAKREERRLRELREELEEAKLERRVAEVVEQERREREMKERLLDFQNGGRRDGDGGQNVGNSPRLGNSPPGSVLGAGADDERSAAAAAAAAASPASPELGEAREALPASPAPVASPEEDALTPHPKLPRSPDITLAKRSPPFDGFDGEGESPGGGGGEGGAEVLRVGVDAPGASAPATPTRRSSGGHRGAPGARGGGTPLDRRIARLEAKLAARDEALERERADRERVERERDLAERERDLEQQLHKIRSELAGVARGDQHRAAAIGRAVAGYRDDVAALRDSRDSESADPSSGGGGGLALARRSFVGTDIDSFVVDSGFVRVDAPVDDDDGVELVPKGYTVRPDELMRRRREAADAGGAAAPRVAGLSRRAARAAAAEREEKLERAERERRRRISNQRIDAARMKENREALAARPAWGARRAGGDKRGNRWM